MPRVTDFPDQRASMLQASLNQRQQNLQSDQMYFDAEVQGQQLKQSMMQMMMGDTLSRDQLAQQQSQFEDTHQEGARQFDESLTEQNRASLEAEQQGRTQLQIMRDDLSFRVDTRDKENAFGVIDKFEDRFNTITQIESQLQQYAQKQARGRRLTGADREDISHLQRQLDMNIALAHDVIQDSGDIAGIDEDMLGNMTTTLRRYAQNSHLGSSFESPSEQGLLTTPFEVAEPTMETRSWLSNAFHVFGDNLGRMLSNENFAPGTFRKAHNSLNQILDPDSNKRFDSQTEKDLTTTFKDFAKFGFGDRGVLAISDERRDENQVRNQEAIQTLWTEAAVAKITDDGRALGYTGGELSEYVTERITDPTDFAQARHDVQPIEMKQAEIDARMMERFQTAMEEMGQEEYMAAAQGGPGVQQLMQLMNLNVPPAQKMREIYNRFDSDRVLFVDPVKRRGHLNQINNLIPFGILGEE